MNMNVNASQGEWRQPPPSGIAAMNPPGWGMRLAGSTPGALVLTVLSFGIIRGWYDGNVPGWLALVAVGVVVLTARAVRRMRSYKAELARGAENEPLFR
jgi:hypothetical protein